MFLGIFIYGHRGLVRDVTAVFQYLVNDLHYLCAGQDGHVAASVVLALFSGILLSSGCGIVGHGLAFFILSLDHDAGIGYAGIGKLHTVYIWIGVGALLHQLFLKSVEGRHKTLAYGGLVGRCCIGLGRRWWQGRTVGVGGSFKSITSVFKISAAGLHRGRGHVDIQGTQQYVFDSAAAEFHIVGYAATIGSHGHVVGRSRGFYVIFNQFVGHFEPDVGYAHGIELFHK